MWWFKDSQLLAEWEGKKRVLTGCLQEIRLNFHEERAIKTDFPLWGGFVGSLKGQVSFAQEPHKNRAFAKETCEFRAPTNRCHPIRQTLLKGRLTCHYWREEIAPIFHYMGWWRSIVSLNWQVSFAKRSNLQIRILSKWDLSFWGGYQRLSNTLPSQFERTSVMERECAWILPMHLITRILNLITRIMNV